MNTTLTIEGMHCEACKMLIKMELEDATTNGRVESIEITEGNTGTVTLKDFTEEELAEAVSAINSIGNYQVT